MSIVRVALTVLLHVARRTASKMLWTLDVLTVKETLVCPSGISTVCGAVSSDVLL